MRNNITLSERVSAQVPTTCVGEKIHTLYSSKVQPDGIIKLIPTSEVNIQEKIQSFLGDCDLNVILARYLNGDVNALNVKPALYGNFTELPKTYAEFLQTAIDAENAFLKLSTDVKQAFDNDYRQWLAQTGSDKWCTLMGIQPVSTKIEKEFKTDVQISEMPAGSQADVQVSQVTE